MEIRLFRYAIFSISPSYAIVYWRLTNLVAVAKLHENGNILRNWTFSWEFALYKCIIIINEHAHNNCYKYVLIYFTCKRIVRRYKINIIIIPGNVVIIRSHFFRRNYISFRSKIIHLYGTPVSTMLYEVISIPHINPGYFIHRNISRYKSFSIKTAKSHRVGCPRIP